MSRAALIAAVLALAACGRDAGLEVKRQRWAAERRGLDVTFDQLEERMLSDQARVRFWRDLRERHEGVTAVACANLDRHAEGMAVLQERQQEKLDDLARKHRVAARFVPSSDVAHGDSSSLREMEH